MGFEINKIIVAVLVTFLVVFGIGKISDLIFQTETNVVAYKVESSTENSAATTISAESTIDMSALLAMGDMAHGEKVFKKCSACHMNAADGKNNAQIVRAAKGNKIFSLVETKRN